MSNSPKTAIVGFKTAHGSMYSYDAETSVVQRLKLSPSYTGQGTTQPEGIAYFVGEAGQNLLLRDFAYNEHYIFFGYTEAEDNQMRYFSGNSVEIPEGGRRAIIIIDRDSMKAVKQAFVSASEPAIGLSPLDTAFYNPEAGYDQQKGTGNPFAHLGNRIVKIYRDGDEFTAHRSAAKELFDQQQASRAIGQP